MQVRIPEDRIGVILGKEGKIKKQIESYCEAVLNVDSKSGLIMIKPRPNNEDPIKIWKARDIVKAIGRGFSPERAFSLLDDDFYLEIISLRDILGNSKARIRRIRGRIIGERGKTKRIIEEITGTFLSIYGYTTSIIGPYRELRIAKHAIEMLIHGATHKTVYRYLEDQRRKMKIEELELWERPPEPK